MLYSQNEVVFELGLSAIAPLLMLFGLFALSVPVWISLGLSALLQTTNFVLEAFSGPTEHHGDPDDPDDHSP